MPIVRPVKVFLSYARDDSYWCNKLRKHLSALKHDRKIELWYDALIRSGDDWLGEIESSLADMEILVFLMSAAFVDSEFCNKEFDAASVRQDRGDSVRLLGVRLRPVRVPEKFSRLQCTPRGKPVRSRRDPDEGFVEAVADIETVVHELLSLRVAKRRSRRKPKR